eukprot:2043058-Karenia_brevis.AAC.1
MHHQLFGMPLPRWRKHARRILHASGGHASPALFDAIADVAKARFTEFYAQGPAMHHQLFVMPSPRRAKS